MFWGYPLPKVDFPCFFLFRGEKERGRECQDVSFLYFSLTGAASATLRR